MSDGTAAKGDGPFEDQRQIYDLLSQETRHLIVQLKTPTSRGQTSGLSTSLNTISLALICRKQIYDMSNSKA